MSKLSKLMKKIFPPGQITMDRPTKFAGRWSKYKPSGELNEYYIGAVNPQNPGDRSFIDAYGGGSNMASGGSAITAGQSSIVSSMEAVQDGINYEPTDGLTKLDMGTTPSKSILPGGGVKGKKTPFGIY